jgi:hypothetical protein
MRNGVNPEKYKNETNKKWLHRVVMVCYIPNLTDDYYKESLLVLKYSLESLIKTINKRTTVITFINNNSVSEVDLLVKTYLEDGSIDKYVTYNENKGKVYPVLNETRSVFEPFVTITDSDVLFFNGWEKGVFEIFNNFEKAGMVSPLPYPIGAIHLNENIFFDKFIFGKIKYSKIVHDYDLNLFLQGTNNPALYQRKKKYNWKEKQYFIKKNDINAIIGATHFVATFKSKLFKNEEKFPELKFKKGYEYEFIDILPAKSGLYRLSTTKTYAYHIGNNLDEFTKSFNLDSSFDTNSEINITNSNIPFAFIPYKLKTKFYLILKKIFKF